MSEKERVMHGTLTIPRATLVGAVSYGRAFGCLVTIAKLVDCGCELTVEAPERALDQLARAHAAGRIRFEPAALAEALRAVSGFAPATAVVHGTLVKRRGGREWCREQGIPVLAVRRYQSLELTVIVPADLLATLAREQATSALTFEPDQSDDVRVELGCAQERALRWAASAAGLCAPAGGFGLLVATSHVRINGARPMRESFAA